MAGFLLVVLALFVPPLFAGLGASDLDGDESIYAGVAESVLDGGHWLTPEYDGAPFLEKPPLKTWLTAAVILATPATANETGFRLADACCGVLTFVYLFLLGCRLGGILCGMGAVFFLAINPHVMFVHGLRANDMESLLVLAYCAAMYHFQRWAGGEHPARQVFAIAGWFSIAFLTKYVAALFLPLILVASVSLVPEWRERARATRRTVLLAAASAVMVVAPWFLYQLWVFGGAFWDFMFVQHVYRRMTAALDPRHLQPWHFYVSELARDYEKVWYYPVVGAIAWLLRVARMRWSAGIPTLLWILLPVSILSLGTSKLLHYAYPFVAPIALFGGYSLAVVGRRIVTIPEGAAVSDATRVALRIVLATALVGSVIVLLVTAGAADHRLAYEVGPLVIRNASVMRPLVFVLLMLLALTGRYRTALGALALCAIALDADREYGRLWERTRSADRLLSSLAGCMSSHSTPGSAEVFAHVPPGVDIPHDVLRYFRPVRRSVDMAPRRLERHLREPSSYGPVIVAGTSYPEVRGRVRGWAPEAQAALGVLPLPRYGLYLMLPGPYAACVASGRSRLD